MQQTIEYELSPEPLSAPAGRVAEIPQTGSNAAATRTAGERLARLVSMDAYRGFVMLLIFDELLHFCSVAKDNPGSWIWSVLCFNSSHVEWSGCSLHDLIQPSFSFLVGVAMPFSLASRAARGESFGRMALHAAWRAFALIWLGVLLRSTDYKRTYFMFVDTLSQIGLGYFWLFLLARSNRIVCWSAFAAILFGYWLLFALWPLPPAGFDTLSVGVPHDWTHGFTGFAAHWNKNTNPAAAFDVWFRNLFPTVDGKPYVFNAGGYETLNFIPTLATMILGLLCGEVLKTSRSSSGKLKWMLIAGVAFLAAGWGCGVLGICPVVKRIWTPSWVLFSGGCCLLLMSAFYLGLDHFKTARWMAFPLIVVGMNSIAAYAFGHLFPNFIRDGLLRHLGSGVFDVLGPIYRPLLLGAAIALVLWLILFWMYRRKIFLRI